MPRMVRRDVVEALEESGWSGEAGMPLGRFLRHPSGAVWTVQDEWGACRLETPCGSAEFSAGAPGSIVLAACLDAAGQESAQTRRVRYAYWSARRRAARRLPHEREGLIFHLERRNRRLEEFARIANAAADVSAKAGEEAAAEAFTLRTSVGHLRARVRELEDLLGAAARPCGRELSTGEPCPDHPRPGTTSVEYLFCGADLGRDEPPYTCNRRVAHDGACGPDMDT